MQGEFDFSWSGMERMKPGLPVNEKLCKFYIKGDEEARNLAARLQRNPLPGVSICVSPGDEHEPDFTERGFAALADVPNLEELKLCGGILTPQALAGYRKLSSLRFLECFFGYHLSAAGLDYLAELPNLESLEIHNSTYVESYLRDDLAKVTPALLSSPNAPFLDGGLETICRLPSTAETGPLWQQ